MSKTAYYPEVWGGLLPASTLKLYSTSGVGSGDFIGLYTGSQTLGIKLNSDSSVVFAGAVSGITTLAIGGALTGVTTITTSGAINGATLDNTAWTTYSPTLTADSGTITTKSASGRYKQIGKLVHVAINLTITTAGTAATHLLKATLPVSEKGSFQWCLIGQGTSGAVTGIIGSDAGKANIEYYNRTSAIFDGESISISGSYEAA